MIPMTMTMPVTNNKRHCIDPRNTQTTKPKDTLLRDDDDDDTSLLPLLDVVSSKLNSLSLEERLQIEHEMHGIFHSKDETAEGIEIKLNEMDKALSELTTHNNPIEKIEDGSPVLQTAVYEKAVELSAEYVEGLKLAFLRTEYYTVRGPPVVWCAFSTANTVCLGKQNWFTIFIFRI
jgi:hypothetical protein